MFDSWHFPFLYPSTNYCSRILLYLENLKGIGYYDAENRGRTVSGERQTFCTCNLG